MQNFLRTYRKKTEITIEDISKLLDVQDCSAISRCERGIRTPCLEMIFTYHLLFNVPIERFFEYDIHKTLQKIIKNIDPLIEELKKQDKTKKVEARISFLNTLKDVISKKI